MAFAKAVDVVSGMCVFKCVGQYCSLQHSLCGAYGFYVSCFSFEKNRYFYKKILFYKNVNEMLKKA